jgi:hypothetical protein
MYQLVRTKKSNLLAESRTMQFCLTTNRANLRIVHFRNLRNLRYIFSSLSDHVINGINNSTCVNSIPVLQTNIPDLQHNIPDLQHNIPDLQHIIPDLRCDIPDLRYDIPDLRCDIPDLRCDIPDLQCDIQDLHSHIPGLHSHIPNLRSHIPVCGKQISTRQSILFYKIEYSKRDFLNQIS